MLENRGHNPMSEVLEDYCGRDLYKALEHYDVHESIPAELEGSSWYEGNTTEKIHTAKFLESLGVEGVQYLDGTCAVFMRCIGRRRNHYGRRFGWRCACFSLRAGKV